MKKKNKENNKEEMPEFAFKQFTPEESKIYEDAVNKFREAITAGKTLKDAYNSYAVDDADLRSLIQADFLKILIAERHFGKGQPLEQIAQALSVPHELMLSTKKRMLQEVGITAATQFGQEHGSLSPKTDD